MFHNKNPKSFVFNFWGSLHDGGFCFIVQFTIHKGFVEGLVLNL